MSINISKAIQEVSTSVRVTVDLDKLGPRQKTALKRALVSGVTDQYSITARIAEKMRSEAGLGYVFVKNGFVRWNSIPKDHPTFSHLKTALVAAMLVDEGNQQWRNTRNATTLKSLEDQEPSGHFYCSTLYNENAKVLRNQLLEAPLAPYTGPMTGLVHIELLEPDGKEGYL